jgi:hypothetical protein
VRASNGAHELAVDWDAPSSALVVAR